MKICLVGNQNCGKTTLFNLLTGLNQKIGNWPGVTIQKKTGIIKGTNYELVDLPGTYSLKPYTEEEAVSTNYIFNEKPDIIINIVDATCLERSLYLTTQLIDLNATVIVAINMTDLLTKKGIVIDYQTLQTELNAYVCKISALKNEGIDKLIDKIIEIEQCQKCGQCLIKRKKYLTRFKFDETEITNRYKYIEKIVHKSLNVKRKWIDLNVSLDKIFLNRIFALPIFCLIMYIIYFLSVGGLGKSASILIQEVMDAILTKFIIIFESSTIPKWLQSLVIEGIFKGVSSVLSFLPQLTILFFCISLLESTGYMSRIAFMLDSLFRKIGLSGKSLIPFIIGSGCSVPGIMSTKIIENPEERKMTVALVSFIPCSAKLPIMALFTGYFFRENTEIVCFSLYIISIIIIVFSSIFIQRFILKKEDGSFITELPDYKVPNMKYVFRDIKEKTNSFIKRAGTTILLSSIIIWVLLSFSTDFKYGAKIEESILSTIGKKISWIFYPMLGTNSWEAAISAVQGFIAKEQVVSSMSIISGFENDTIAHSMFSRGQTFSFFTKWSGYSFIIFNLFSAPCLATIATLLKELGSLKKTFYVIIYQIMVAWIVATVFYQFSLLLF